MRRPFSVLACEMDRLFRSSAQLRFALRSFASSFVAALLLGFALIAPARSTDPARQKLLLRVTQEGDRVGSPRSLLFLPLPRSLAVVHTSLLLVPVCPALCTVPRGRSTGRGGATRHFVQDGRLLLD
ncbi:hypothetical protein RTBOTA2_005910 [Rhodotorula toruloides]|nr:hypothetical protein RTBOTA2_005910 [Rhodotorula toruloides]